MTSRKAAQTKDTRAAVCSTRVSAATLTVMTSRSLVRGSRRNQPSCADAARSCISGDSSNAGAHEMLAQHLLTQQSAQAGGYEDKGQQSG